MATLHGVLRLRWFDSTTIKSQCLLPLSSIHPITLSLFLQYTLFNNKNRV